MIYPKTIPKEVYEIRLDLSKYPKLACHWYQAGSNEWVSQTDLEFALALPFVIVNHRDSF